MVACIVPKKYKYQMKYIYYIWYLYIYLKNSGSDEPIDPSDVSPHATW